MDREIKQKNPRLRKYAKIGVPVILLVGLLIWAFAGTGDKVYRTDANSLTISDVTNGNFNDYIRLSGQVEAGIVVQVSALETGIVEQKLIAEGAMVNAGDIILTLRNPNLQQQILDSEAQLAEKQNMLRDTEIAMEKERLSLRQDVLSTQTERNRMRRLYNQQKSLYDEKLVAHEEYLKAKEDYELADQKLRLLRDRIRQDSLYRSVQVKMMRESLSNMMQNLTLVRQRADNLNIRASHSGQLGNLDAEIGQNIATGQMVGQINVLNDYKIIVNIDEHYIDRVAIGLNGKFERQNSQYAVNVSKVYPEVKNGQFRTDLVFSGQRPDKIRVGQTYYINLQLGEPTKAVLVPRGSFYQATGGKWIYVLTANGKEAVKRQIKIGRQNPQYYEVLEGLKPGERVITSSYENFGEAEKILVNL
ncbi:MAG: HlyD family efflux transporter periplasmic adaptor subunit [Prevotella sp.]|nr:HlyD family efflux transporter periplasmic adaptor subunit [Prevotella sp.]MDE7456811.1 HlyD family efflux transporter periplasmic adaptor subunit [Prevotella sp.]